MSTPEQRWQAAAAAVPYAVKRRMRAEGTHIDGIETHPECMCGLCRHARKSEQPAAETTEIRTRAQRARHTQEETLF